jgi:hypothetical protein
MTPINQACPAYPVSIFIAGADLKAVKNACRTFCDDEAKTFGSGLCVTVTPTSYIYTGGEAEGVIVGLINYPRFPAEPGMIFAVAKALAEKLVTMDGHESYTIQTPDAAFWTSYRPADMETPPCPT